MSGMVVSSGPAAERSARAAAAPWWAREDLSYREGRLHFAREPLDRLAASLGTPLYVYSAARARANLERLHAALAGVGLDYRVFYAMKSNRHAPLLARLAATGLCGIDACSPEEVALARQVGFAESRISFTGTSVSDADLDRLARFPDVWVNCDSLSSVRRLAQRSPGREIGLRVNPGVGVGYRANDMLRYAGERPTKFGIYRDRFQEAVDLVASLGLRLRGLHVHAGCGYLTPQLEAWEGVLDACVSFLELCPEVRHVNVGGGLGIPLVEDDAPLDLGAWAALLARKLGGRGVQVWVEPGDYVAKDAGVLLLEVNTVEEKDGVRFVGVNGGFNVHVEPAFYRLPLEIVPVRLPAGGGEPEGGAAEPDDGSGRAVVAGNINEALDVWAEEASLPGVREGDVLAFLNAGGYGASMSSNHCMRGHFVECLLG